MKRVFRLPAIIVALLGIVFSSCSNLNESTSLSLTFNGSDFAPTSARNISVSSEYEGMYIVASVLGDYTETKSLEISSSGTYSIEFDNVPVGAQIYVEANVYNPNYTDDFPYCHTYTGTSEKQTVYSGENTINLAMKNLARNTDNFITLSGDSSNNMGAYTFIGYENGKYKVVYSDNEILSEGIWSASYEEETGVTAGTVVQFKECVYKTYASAEVNGPQEVSNVIIVEKPIWKSFTVKNKEQGSAYLEVGSTKIFE